jgi:thiol-disulfide isomerase/thioredoxin
MMSVVLLSLMTAISASAGSLGDPAAPLTIKEWVKGKAVDVKDGKNVYVVEFWATWCPPCRESIPHLTGLQKKLKDKNVVFIGISDETPDKVKPFVEKMGDKMDYVVAVDDERKTSDGYMKAFNEGGIPHAFIVGKEGTVLWRGHPMDKLDQALDQILAGKYDLAAAKKRSSIQGLFQDYQKLAAAGDAKTKELGRQLLADNATDIDALCQLAFVIVANGRDANRDFALADEALDNAEKLAGGKEPRTLGVRAIGRFESGKQEDGIALVKEAINLSKKPEEKQRYESYLKVMENRKGQKADQ